MGSQLRLALILIFSNLLMGCWYQEGRIIIDAPIDEVWRYTGDSTNAAEWSVFFDHIEPQPGIEDGKVGALRRCFRRADKTGLTWDETITKVVTYRYRQLRTYNIKNSPIPGMEEFEFDVYHHLIPLGPNQTELVFASKVIKSKMTLSTLSLYIKAGREAEKVILLNLENIKRAIENRRNNLQHELHPFMEKPNPYFDKVENPRRHPQSESDCKALDLRPHFGPPRSQGNIGWCYANATADVISYHFRDELKHPASAIAIALNFNYHWLADNMREGGFMFLALQNAFRTGVCPQFFDQEIMSKGIKESLREKLNFILHMKDKVDAGEDQYVYDQIVSSQKSGSTLKYFKPYDLMTLLAISDRNRVLGNISDSLCGGYRHHFKKSAKVNWSTKYPLNSKNRIFNELNRALDQSLPVGIAYFAGFFEKDNAPHNSANRHMSVVVGRKYNAKTLTCEYLIRNSYGNTCHSYKNPKLKDKCEKGNIWVDTETLKYNLYGLTYLTEK